MQMYWPFINRQYHETFSLIEKQLSKNMIVKVCSVHTSSSLSVTDATPPRKQVTVNSMVRNCNLAIVTTVQVQVNTWWYGTLIYTINFTFSLRTKQMLLLIIINRTFMLLSKLYTMDSCENRIIIRIKSFWQLSETQETKIWNTNIM